MSSTAETQSHRDWKWDNDGALDGLYVETREVTVRNGPSAGRQKLIFDFHVGVDDEAVSVWETAVLRSKFSKELRARRKPDFEAGESDHDRAPRLEGERKRALPRLQGDVRARRAEADCGRPAQLGGLRRRRRGRLRAESPR